MAKLPLKKSRKSGKLEKSQKSVTLQKKPKPKLKTNLAAAQSKSGVKSGIKLVKALKTTRAAKSPVKPVKKPVKKIVKKAVLKKTIKKPVPKKTLIKTSSAAHKSAAKIKSLKIKKIKISTKTSTNTSKKPVKPVKSFRIKNNPVNKPIINKLKTQPHKLETKKMKQPVIQPLIQTASEEIYMTPEQQANFREILLTWKKQLLGEMERTVHHMQDDVTAFADPNDRATQEEEFSLELRTRDRERKLIKKIEEALIRLNTKDYGYCEDCGIEIGLKRLEARPTATLCIDCKTIEEIREKSASD